jgi:hypothetical protein
VSVVGNFCEPGFDLQTPFDAAVVIGSIVRPTLKDALLSVFRQTHPGRIQIMLGIDKAMGDRAVIEEALKHRPPNQVVTLLDLGYSTSVRHGGVHADLWGGALHTVLSYLANSRYITYLADDNWMHEQHIATLLASIRDYDWAFSLRWYVDDATRKPLCVDLWESVGPGKGVYAQTFGGFVDPNCMFIDKVRCEPVLRHRSLPFMSAAAGLVPSDRGLFEQLRHRPWVCTGQPTSYYTIQPSDTNHESRMTMIRAFLASQGNAALPPNVLGRERV